MDIERTAIRTLLMGLLAGAETPLHSVAAWETRLHPLVANPLLGRFMDQLRGEWPAASPPNAFCAQITEQVQERVSAWHPGWPHLWGHILRVTGVALTLAAEAQIDPVLVYLTGICHDVAKLDEEWSTESHEELGADFVSRMLDGELPYTQVKAIERAILKEGEGDLARVLHDADKLDKIGAAGIVRRISTDTRPDWLRDALDRVEDDWDKFPNMYFERSRELTSFKSNFLGWFLPQAQAAVRG